MMDILNVVLHFAIGFFIPIFGRFLSKSYPCSLHSFIGDGIKYYLNKKICKQSHHLNSFKSLNKRYFYSKLLYGALFAVLTSFLNDLHLNLFVWLLLLAGYIDAKVWVIPDLITLPLLFTGLSTTLFQSNKLAIYNAIGIYIICSALALFAHLKNNDSFGGGDVKLLAAVAALLGAEITGLVLVGAAIVAAPYCMAKKTRQVPLAPFVSASAIASILILRHGPYYGIISSLWGKWFVQ
ncbi:MAG: prepilin peptidase [Rickettsiales bacterium]|jgi:prepilin signal peptidase PulO-like enzyme (type II secretory pathway)|nr:prepilin peptidase [Rickettsiales bacterium]